MSLSIPSPSSASTKPQQRSLVLRDFPVGDSTRGRLQCHGSGGDKAPANRPRTAAPGSARRLPRRHHVGARLGHGRFDSRRRLARLCRARDGRARRRALLGLGRRPLTTGARGVRLAGRLRRLDRDLGGLVSPSVIGARRRPARALLRRRDAHASRHAALGGRQAGRQRRRRPGHLGARGVDRCPAARGRRSGGLVSTGAWISPSRTGTARRRWR